MSVSSRGRTPAAAAALALALGIFLASSGLLEPSSHTPLCVLSGVLLVPATVNLVVRRAGRSRASPFGVLVDLSLLAALALAGWATYDVRQRLVAPSDISRAAPAEGLSADVTIIEVRGRPGGRASAVGRVVKAVARPSVPDAGADACGVTHCEGAATSGLLWMSWPEGHEPPQRGESVRVAGTLSRPRAPRNPGSFDFASYLSSRNIRAVFAVERTERLGPARGAARAAAWIERTVKERLAGEPGALLTGLLLGATTSVPDELLDSFRRSGTVHVLAVSGLHVGFIVLVAYAFLRLLRVPTRFARLLVLPCLAGFVALVGPRPSVVRASIMAGAFVVAWSLERRPNPLNTIGLAAISILLVRPGALSDLGFRLSFGATASIVTLFPVLRPRGTLGDRLGRAGRFITDSLALSASAQLGVAPVLVAAFGRFSVAAVLANIAVVPLAGFSVVSGMATLATVSVPAISRLFAASAYAALTGVQAVATFFAGLDAATIDVPTRLWPAFAVVALGLGAVAAARRVRRIGSRAAFISCAVVVLIAAAGACALTLEGPGRSHLRLVVFDVGQGDAILLEIPGRRSVLIDAGDAWNVPGGRDAGRDVVVPYLRATGTGRLDALVVTHAHRDHVGGARSVLAACGADDLVLSRGSGGHAAFSELVAAARAARSEVSWVARGDRVLTAPACTLAVLWPPEAPCESASTENDRSIVIRAGTPRVAALLTGDIEAPAEGHMSPRAALRADILKVPHHGSGTSSSVEFIRAVRPRLGLVSVGAGNRYGHPDAQVLARLQEAGATILRTDRDGAIIVDVLADRIVARGFASGRTVVLRYRQPEIGEGPATAIER